MEFIRLFLYDVQLTLQTAIFLFEVMDFFLEGVLDVIDHLLNLGEVQASHFWVDVSLNDFFFISLGYNFVNGVELNLLGFFFYFFQADWRFHFAALDHFLGEFFSEDLDGTHQVGVVVELVENILEVLRIYPELYQVTPVWVANLLAGAVQISLCFINPVQTHQDARSI